MLEAVEDFTSDDLLEAARAASSAHRELTAEIWQDGRKAAVIRPCEEHYSTHVARNHPPTEPIR